MKKLMAMIGALACAGGVWAAAEQTVYPSAQNFDGLTDGTVYKYDASTSTMSLMDSLWSWAETSTDYELKVTAWTDATKAAYTDTRPENGGDTNYLTVETSFTTPVYRTVKGVDDSGKPISDDTFGEQVYFDSLVELTAGETNSLHTATLPVDARIAVYLGEIETTVDGNETTENHLFVRAGKKGLASGTTSDQLYDCGTDVTAGWHRLTVRCFKDVTRTGAGIAGYVVYIDGSAVSCVEGSTVPEWAEDADFVPKCAALNTAHKLFPSLLPAATGIKAVGFAGNGKIDDIIFTTTRPGFLTDDDDRNYFYLSWDEGVASATWKIGDGNATAIDLTESYAAIPLNASGETVVTVAATYKTNYAAGEWTVDAGNSVSQQTGEFTISAGQLTPAGKIVSASDITVANATITIKNGDGTTKSVSASGKTLQETLDNISAAITEAGEGATAESVCIKLAADTKVELTLDDREEVVGTLYLADGYPCTLDLNGKTITGSIGDGVEDVGGAAYLLENNGTLVITDSSATPGTIKFEKTTTVVLLHNTSDLTIEAGVYGGYVFQDGDSLSITGGSFLASANSTDENMTEFALADYVDTEKATAPEATSKIGDVDYWVVTPKGVTPETVTLTVAEYDTAQITSVTITNEAGTAFASGATFVKAEATKLTVVPVFAEGYELDTEKSTSLEITMDKDQTVTLVAKAVTPTTYTVTFVNEKAEPTSTEQAVAKNAEGKYYATEPTPAPTADGYKFLGWYAENAETAFDFANTEITANITLTAKWAEVVATVDGTSYTDLPSAVSAATTKATGGTEVTLNIVKSTTLTSTLEITGSGKDASKITLNVADGVTVNMVTTTYAAKIDGVTLTFTGSGTWSRAAASGESAASMFSIGRTTAADVIVTSGNFVAGSVTGGNGANTPANILQVKKGSLTVNGGNFTSYGAYGEKCVSADSSGTTVVVNGGVFTMPMVNAGERTNGPKIVDQEDGTAYIPSDSKAVFKGYLKNLMAMKSFLVTKNEDGSYAATSNYKLKEIATGDYAGYYEVAEITWATLTVAADEGVASYTLKDADGNTITLDDNNKAKFDADLATVVTASDITYADDYEAATEGNVLTATLTADQTITIKATQKAAPATTVATITVDKQTESFTTFDAAVTRAIELGTAQIDIIADIDMDSTVCPYKLTGKGIDTTKITFNVGANVTVAFTPAAATKGFLIDSATVVFAGEGTWKMTGSVTKFIDISSANVTVQSGTFVCENNGSGDPVSGILRAKSGATLTVEGGTFTTKGTVGLCVEGGTVVVKGGVIDVEWAAPDSGTPHIVEYASGTLQVPADSMAKFKCLVKVEALVAEVASHIVDSSDGTKKAADYGLTEITEEGDYKGYYEVTKTAVEPSYDPVDAGSTKTCATEDDATALAAAINADKANLITIPNAADLNLTDAQKTAYDNLFVATANGTVVTVDFTEDATNTLAAAAETIVESIDLQTLAATALNASATLAEITDAQPGLFYTLLVGNDTPATLPTAISVQANNEGKVTFTLEKSEDYATKAFFKVVISAQEIKSTGLVTGGDSTSEQ